MFSLIVLNTIAHTKSTTIIDAGNLSAGASIGFYGTFFLNLDEGEGLTLEVEAVNAASVISSYISVRKSN